jgi:serine protease Do
MRERNIQTIWKLISATRFRVALTVVLLCGASALLGVFMAGRFTNAGPRENFVAVEQLSASFSEVARGVEPAVVNIDTKGNLPQISIKGETPDSEVPEPLRPIFEGQKRKPTYGVGSGFIVDKTGYVLTNAHVVADASRITVRLQNGEEYLAKIVGTDEETDLAVLKLESAKDLPTVRLGDSDASQVGDWVLAVGSPFGLAQTVTAGIISQTKRETPLQSPFRKFIQTDAAINRGNSGGPLVNMRGEVIGINSQIATSVMGEYTGIGFALPSNEAAFVYQQILKNGRVRRGYLGVTLDSVKNEYAKVYGFGENRGAIITDIRDKNGAAAIAGILVGDVISEFNGRAVLSAQDLISLVGSTEPETEIALTILRENGEQLERKTLKVKLGERPTQNRVEGETIERKKISLDPAPEKKTLGLTLSELTPPLATGLKLVGQKGVLVKEVDPASFLFDVKNADGSEALTEGDLIQRINRNPVASVKDFEMVATKLKSGDALVLHVVTFNRSTQKLQSRIIQATVR